MEKMIVAIYDLKGIDNRKGEYAPKGIFRELLWLLFSFLFICCL